MSNSDNILLQLIKILFIFWLFNNLKTKIKTILNIIVKEIQITLRRLKKLSICGQIKALHNSISRQFPGWVIKVRPNKIKFGPGETFTASLAFTRLVEHLQSKYLHFKKLWRTVFNLCWMKIKSIERLLTNLLGFASLVNRKCIVCESEDY